MKTQVDIGVIGAEVTNPAKAMQEQGYTVALYTPAEQSAEATGHGAETIDAETLQELVSLVKRPRQIRIQVPSWRLLNDIVDKLNPLLDDEDLLIDDSPKLHVVGRK